MPNSNDPASMCLTICAKTSAWWSLISRIAVPWVAVTSTVAVGRSPSRGATLCLEGHVQIWGRSLPSACLLTLSLSLRSPCTSVLTLLLRFGVMSAKALLPSSALILSPIQRASLKRSANRSAHSAQKTPFLWVTWLTRNQPVFFCCC